MNNIVIFDFQNILAILKRLKDTYKYMVSNTSKCLSDPIERDGRIYITLIEKLLMYSYTSKKDLKK